MKNIFFFSFLLLIFSCGEEIKNNNTDSTALDSLLASAVANGKTGDVPIEELGLLVSMPVSFWINGTSKNDRSEYVIRQADTLHNNSFIKICLGPVADTVTLKTSYTRDEGPAQFLGHKARKVVLRSGNHYVVMIFIDNWKDGKLMIEENTANQVEALDLDKVMNSIRVDSAGH
jgi:hypothetical protein